MLVTRSPGLIRRERPGLIRSVGESRFGRVLDRPRRVLVWVGPGLVAQHVGTLIGDMTANGGLAAAFDGVKSQTAANSAVKGGEPPTTGTVGKKYKTPGVRVTGYKAWSSSDEYGFSGSPNDPVNLKLQGSNDTTDGLDGTWIDLDETTDTTPPTPGGTRFVDRSTQVDGKKAVRAVRLRIHSPNSGAVFCAELEIFGFIVQ